MASGSDQSLAPPAHSVAAGLCLFGCFLYMVLSEPLLNALGLHSTGSASLAYQKLHPGALPVLLSFVILLAYGGKPWRNLGFMWRQQPAAIFLLAAVSVIFVYAAARNGAHGIGFLIDTHLAAPVIALVLAYAPPAYLRKAACGFIAFTALDGVIGIGEFISHHRIYSFDPAWGVLHEHYFRASSLMGRPLASSLFLPVALFTALNLDLPRIVKSGLIVLVPLALVAFGGYFALAVTIFGLALLGAISARRLTVARASLLAALFLIGVAALIAQILCSPSECAAALAEYHYMLDSQSRAFGVLHLLNMHEFIFGVSSERIAELAAGMGIAIPRSDIDSPWVLMLLTMGCGFFLLWLVATVRFLRALTGQSLALACAVLAYFIIASASNSFGREDAIYPAMIGLVVCAAGQEKRLAAKRQF